MGGDDLIHPALVETTGAGHVATGDRTAERQRCEPIVTRQLRCWDGVLQLSQLPEILAFSDYPDARRRIGRLNGLVRKRTVGPMSHDA